MAWGQGFGLQPPTLGVVYNPSTRAVQRIDGIPGSATFGSVLLADVDSAALAPDAAAALVGRGARKFLVSALATADPQWTPVPDDSNGVAWAADGSQAVLAANRAVLVFRQVDGQFQLQKRYAVELDGVVSAAALDPDGAAALLVVASGNAAGVYRISLDTGIATGIATGFVEFVLPVAGRLAWSQARSGDLFVLQADAARVHRLHASARGGIEIADFPVAALEGANFTAISCSADGRRVAVVDSGTRAVLLYGSDGQFLSRLDVDFAPSQAEAVGDRFSVLMAGAAGQPFFLLDFFEPRAFFVPAFTAIQ